VECVFGSPASEVVAMVVHLFGCVGSNERMVGDLEVVSVFWQWRLPERVLEAWFVDDGLVPRSSVVVILDESLALWRQ
jgi:hypothetical protein